MLIGEVKNHMWVVAGRVAQGLPKERVRELEQAVFRLTAYVKELEWQKSLIDKAWAELERQ